MRKLTTKEDRQGGGEIPEVVVMWHNEVSSRDQGTTLTGCQ